jgi:hypothetical protein
MGRFDEAMRASEEVSGSTAILDHERGVISSRFQAKPARSQTPRRSGSASSSTRSGSPA